MLSSCVWQVLLGNRGTLYILLGNMGTLYIRPSVPQLALDKLNIVNIWPFWHRRKTPLWMTLIISDFQRTVLLRILLTIPDFHLSLLTWNSVHCELEFFTNEPSRLHREIQRGSPLYACICSTVQLKITWIIEIDVLQKTILKQIRKWIIHCFP